MSKAHDPAIIEAAVRALLEDEDIQLWDYPHIARCILAAVTPLIEAAALERAAKVAEEIQRREIVNDYSFDACRQIAAAIRALIIKDSGGGE